MDSRNSSLVHGHLSKIHPASSCLMQPTLATYYADLPGQNPNFFADAYILGVRCIGCCGPDCG